MAATSLSMAALPSCSSALKAAGAKEFSDFSAFKSTNCATLGKRSGDLSMVVAAQSAVAASSGAKRAVIEAKLKVAINGPGRNFIHSWHRRKDSPLEALSLHSRRLSESQFKKKLFGASLPGLVSKPLVERTKSSQQNGVTCMVEEASANIDELPETSEKPIWMSNVVVKRRRNYFKNREWTSKDLSYAGFMAFMHGLCLFAPATFSWNAFGVFMGLYVLTGMLGITLSFHRNLSHKSFKVPKWLEYTFAYCGVQAVQGDPVEWVSSHRYHHQHCDTENDPHTPYEGFWHSHMGWLLDDQSTQERVGARSNVGDMDKEPFYQFIQKTYPIHPIMMAVALYAIGGFPYIVWGMAVRTVWVYHITWFVNSASHVWGSQKWNTGDLSRNNWFVCLVKILYRWVAMLAFGEGWHNNHHAFEYSARHGLEWWQLDPTWWLIRSLEAVGLATKVKLPKKEHMEKLAYKST